jgi:glycosyltransferase involved in cell wall biosynthesis
MNEPVENFLISSITSIYKSKKFLENFVQQFRLQTIFAKIEIILVDCNEDDEDCSLIKDFCEEPNVKYFKLTPDPGTYAAWNFGIKKTTTNYISNSNTDDVKAPWYFETMSNYMDLHPETDVAYGVVGKTTNPAKPFYEDFCKETWEIDDCTLETMKHKNPPHCMPTWRKSLHCDVGYYSEDYRSAADYELWLRCLDQNKKIDKINLLVGNYYFNPVGLSTNPEEQPRIDKEVVRARTSYRNKNYGPKLVHRVWMGPNEKPEEDYHSSSFEKHLPDWKNKDWEDSDEEEIRELMLEIDPRLLVCFEKYSKYFVVRADVIRHCVLYKYGGIYTDYDVELYSQSLHEKIKEDPSTPLFMVETVLSDEFKKFTSGFSNRNGEEECKTRIGSYLLYSPPKNKIIKSIINLIAERLSQDIEIKEDYDIIWMTGPDTISTVVNSTKEKFNLISLQEQHNICEHKLTGVATWRQAITEGKKNILYVSGFGGSSGSSQAARGYAKILSRNKDINFKILSTNSLWENNKSSRWVTELSPYLLDHRGLPYLKEQEYTVIYHIEPSQQYLDSNSRQCSIDLGDLLNNSSKNISVVAWESDKIPSTWKQFYKKYNFSSVVVSSTYQKNVFESSLDIPIYNTPYAVEVNKSAKNVLNESFSILGVSQWSYRKGFDILIQAFNAEFYNDPNVSLTIKTYGMLWDPNDKKNILREIEEYKANTAQINNQPKCTIKYWYGDITRDQLQNLYGEADLFALATRGEGFGLTIAEALLNGKRVLVPDKGGHVDYIHKNNYWIKSRLETLRCAGWSVNYSSEFKLIEPDFEDTRVKLRQAYNDFKNSKQEWANKQKESTIFTKNYLSEDIIKKKLEEIIKCQINIDSVN